MSPRFMTAACLVVLGCNQNVINTPIRSFDRPSDVALACNQFNPRLGMGGQFYARPLDDCRPDRAASLTFTDSLGRRISPFLRGLVANSARGELALVDASGGALISLNRAVPGFGFLPLGSLPEHIRASNDGCFAVTSNLDSCDLSLVDLVTLYNSPFVTQQPDMGSYADRVVRRLVPAVLVPGTDPPQYRRLGARPTWIEFAPESTAASIDDATGRCSGGSYRAWVALPGCQLVAELDLSQLSSGAGLVDVPVVNAIQFTASGAQVVADVSTLSCPAECGGGTEVPVVDAGAPGDGGLPAGSCATPRNPTAPAPATLAVDVEGGVGRLFIGDLGREAITVVPIDSASGLLGTPRAIRLEACATGVSAVRVSPRSQAGKFLYAVARDASVRVIDLDREVECETNPDPRLLTNRDPLLYDRVPPPDPLTGARRYGCFPLGDPATPPRSATATSPGISLPGGSLPRDVAFVHVDQLPPPTASNQSPPRASPGFLVGDFAWIVASDGRATLINVFDGCPEPNVPQSTGLGFTPACSVDNAIPSRLAALSYFGHPLAQESERLSHRIRPGSDRFAIPANPQDTSGTPRIPDESNPFTLTIAGTTTIDTGNTLPSLVRGTFRHPTDSSRNDRFSVAFNDLTLARNETWSLVWEGVLSGTSRTGGRPLAAESVTIQGQSFQVARLLDPGSSFCGRYVLAGDKLLLRGCQNDLDCGVSQSCARDPSAPADVMTGLCLDKINLPARIAACAPLLRSTRIYRILSAKQGVVTRDPYAPGGQEVTDQLTFAPIFQPEHPIDTRTCTAPADCVAVKSTDLSGASLDTSCLLDVGFGTSGVRRCLVPCDPAAPRCGRGFSCGNAAPPDARVDFRCMRAPLADQNLLDTCMRELQVYEIHAGEAFLVSATVNGLYTNVQPSPPACSDDMGQLLDLMSQLSSRCRECEIPNSMAASVQLRQSRIPIEPATSCDQLTPCCGLPPITALVQPDPMLPPEPDTSLNTLGPGRPNVCLVPRATAETSRKIHFENPVLSLAVNLPDDHLVPPDGFVLSFNTVGGTRLLQVGLGIEIQALQPRAAVTAPDRQTVFVIDEGKQATATGLRGQLLRLLSASQTVDPFFKVR